MQLAYTSVQAALMNQEYYGISYEAVRNFIQ